MHYSRTAQLGGKQEAEEESIFSVLLYVFIKSCLQLTSAAQNQAGLGNLCVKRAVAHLQALILVCFFYSAPWPLRFLPRLALVPIARRTPGEAGDPGDICCLLHMWLDLTQTHRWEREIPGGGNAQFRWRPTWRNGSGNS